MQGLSGAVSPGGEWIRLSFGGSRVATITVVPGAGARLPYYVDSNNVGDASCALTGMFWS